MVFGRILFPSAKLALVDHARGTLLAAACGLDQAREDFDEDDLYAAMDELTGRWVPLEQQLYAQSFPQGVSLVLYDLSSVYFEGDGPVGISRYGHSRDHRSDRPQVFLAVAADARGFRCISKSCAAIAAIPPRCKHCWGRCAGASGLTKRFLCLMAG